MKKFLLFAICIFCFQIAKAQNEFITIWQPGIISNPTVNVNAPFQATSNQVWFPGIGQNYTISWEEIGFPQHNGTMNNVTSTNQVLIDFGIPSKEDGSSATYRIKVSNGNGVFQQIRFATYQPIGPSDILLPILQMQGSADKLLTIEQWGNITWTSMSGAFANCQRMQLTATDSPNLSNVTNAALMFYRTNSFSGADSMQNWNTSNIQTFSFMFAQQHVGQIYSPDLNTFNPPLNNWNVSSATDLSYMFTARTSFNQNLNLWNVSNVKNTAWMFGVCSSFNQPLNNWNTSSLKEMHYMFTLTPFNQPLNNWNTSNVLNMTNAFAQCSFFNQPLDSWNVSSVTRINSMFGGATSFNQSLATWNLNSLTSAMEALSGSGINCENYSKTLSGWADNPNTPNNISLNIVSPAQYAADVTVKRNILISKGWTIIGDTVGSCVLSTSETQSPEKNYIYPNPATNHIYINNVKNAKNYKIYETSGRMIAEGNIKSEKIDISTLSKGNYILQIVTKDKTQIFKFIKE